MITVQPIETRGRKREEILISQLTRKVREEFEKITDIQNTKGRPRVISLADCLMSALAIFSLKYPSLLQFDQHVRENSPISHNISKLYKVEDIPCDTYMRERLDLIEMNSLRPIFNKVLTSLQRDKVLENYTYLTEGYILSLDGTGYFSSHQIHCKNCCEKHHSNGTTTYYHQLLAASLVHPERKEVIALCPEPIHKKDGWKKNDCERVASKRLLEKIRKEHPLLSLVIVEDALASNAPHIRLLEHLNMRYILGIKPDGNKYLFDWLEGIEFENLLIQEKNVTHKFRFYNQVPLNDANQDVKVNFLEYWQIEEGKETGHWSWVTDIIITKNNVYKIMKSGRARWKIENETFNTLKNQGYHFEHNFGHGYNNLTDVLAALMMLAFLIDQAQTISCQLFQTGKRRLISWRSFWERFRSIFFEFFILSWQNFYKALAYGHHYSILVPDTS